MTRLEEDLSGASDAVSRKGEVRGVGAKSEERRVTRETQETLKYR